MTTLAPFSQRPDAPNPYPIEYPESDGQPIAEARVAELEAQLRQLREGK